MGTYKVMRPHFPPVVVVAYDAAAALAAIPGSTCAVTLPSEPRPLIAIYYDEQTGQWTLLSRANADDNSCITTSSDLDELLSIGRDVATGG